MATIVSFPFILTQPVHCVPLDYVLRVGFDEFLGTVPKRGNCLNIFVEADHKTVLLAVFLHILERIETNITVQLNAWLNPPIPLVLIHQRLAEEKARLKPTHVPITGRVPVNDFPFMHVLPDLARFFLIDPFWKRPMFLGNLPVVGFPRYEGGRDLLEIRIEWFIIKKHPIVVMILIESILDLTNRLDYLP